MKKWTTLLLIIMILLTTTTSFAYTTNQKEVKYKDYAEKLAMIGVFKGTDSGFELDRKPTRLEGLVMLIRLLGKEKEALAMANEPCVFTDVPSWGKGYVNYAYKNSLTFGIGENLFGTNESLNAKGFSTFLLRSLGYNDSKGDFNYNESVKEVLNKRIIDENTYKELNSSTFLRKHIAVMAYNGLKTTLKNTEKTLAEYLIFKKVISQNTAKEIAIIDEDYKNPIKERKNNLWTNHNLQDYLSFTLDKNTIEMKGNTQNKEIQWLWFRINDKDRLIYESFIKVNTNGEISDSLVVNIPDGNYSLEIYKAPERYTTYWSWYDGILLNQENNHLYFPLSPVYMNNYEKFYFGKKDIDKDKLLEPISDNQEIIDLANKITKGITSDYEKAMAIHDWVADNIYYNFDGFYSNDYGSTTAEGTLKNKTSVCEGYANLTQALLRAVHIPSIKVSGYALGVGTAGKWTKDNIDNLSNHAWNEAYVDGRWIIIDTTWSSLNKYENGEYIYRGFTRQYFDISLDYFSLDHKIMRDYM